MTAETLQLLTVDDVTLEAELVLPQQEPWLAAVITHPHPLHGGNMYAPVNAQLHRIARQLGLASLRFNFRGAGGSQGVHDNGQAEQHDVAAAVDYLHQRFPSLHLVLAGWSFGADLALSNTHPALAGWYLVAPPLGFVDSAQAASADARPKNLLVPENDQFNPPAKAREATAQWAGCTIEDVAGADHFMAGATDKLTESFTQWLEGFRR